MLKRTSTFISILVLFSLILTGVVMAQGPVQESADAFFSGGPKHIAAADVFDNLNDGDDSNNPFIIDMRLAGDYELSHVPGAANIGAKALFTADGLAQVPEGKDLVVYCYTGHTSSQATSALNMLGYAAKSMAFGFPAWSNEMLSQQSGSQPFNNDTDRHDYITSDEAVTAESGNDPAAALGDTVQAAAEGYFVNGTKNIKSSALFENLNDGDDSNDPLVIDTRKAEDYAKSHIPGAINNPSGKTLFSADGLAGIPADKQVVVNCYTGQTASQVTSVLNMLGYDAANLKFGYASWSPDGGYSFDAAKSPNYRSESGAAEAAPADTASAQELSGDFAVVQGRVEEWLGSVGKPVISVNAVFENLNDGDDNNNPYILSVRSPDHYALGHVPTAKNIPWRTVAKDENLAKLPTDKQIVDYCYTGHTGQAAMTSLSLMGYDAVNMKFGIMAWTKNDDVLVAGRFDPDAVADYAVETEPNEATETYDFPVIDTGGADKAGIIQGAVDAYLSSDKKPTMSPQALFENLNDGDESNDPIILSVRSPDHYNIGHIPGAINIPWKEIGKADNLAKLPPDKPIVVYCYTGHTGQVATTLLNVLGYDAVNLKWGMMNWSKDLEVLGQTPFDPATQADYRIESGAEATTAAPAPAATAAPAEQPAQLPATGGVVFSFTWLYLLFGGSLVGAGAYLRRK